MPNAKNARSKRKLRASQVRPVVQPNAAGIDLGATLHLVAVPPDRDAEPVRSFGTLTGDLHALADWLVTCKITTVAMEATGVYWIPLFQILEARGLEVCLVNARHVKNVPGRKTDVNDSMWLADLLAHGLIRASFVPPAQVQELRTLTRTRKQFVRERGSHAQRIEKILEDANLKLSSVISDILGKSGRAVLKAIIDGQTDP